VSQRYQVLKLRLNVFPFSLTLMCYRIITDVPFAIDLQSQSVSGRGLRTNKSFAVRNTKCYEPSCGPCPKDIVQHGIRDMLLQHLRTKSDCGTSLKDSITHQNLPVKSASTPSSCHTAEPPSSSPQLSGLRDLAERHVLRHLQCSLSKLV